MQFLRTTFWVAIAVILAIVASENWRDVTLDLWGNIQLDIKIPVLLGLIFLVGFLPPFLIMRARLWQLRRRLESLERAHAAPAAIPADEAPQPEDRASP
jgi:lipopolysaccharide assembly protein A